MLETLRNYESEDGTIKLRKVVAGRVLEPMEAKELLEKRIIGPLQGFRSKAAGPFAAALKLNDAGETEFVFGQRAGECGWQRARSRYGAEAGHLPGLRRTRL